MNAINTRSFALTAALITCTGLAACGGESGEKAVTDATSDSADMRSSEIMPIESANGIYHGSLGMQSGDSQLVTTLVHNGQVMAFSPDRRTVFDGYIDLVSDGGLTGEIAQYSGQALTRQGRASLDGVITPRQFISAAVRTGATPGAALLDYSTRSTNAASLTAVSDIWAWYHLTGVDAVALYVDDQGVIDGADQAGCVYHGDLSVPDGAENLYLVDITVSICRERNGQYQGMAYIEQVPGEADRLHLAMTDGKNAQVYPLERRGVTDSRVPQPSLPTLPDGVSLPQIPATPDRVDLPETPDSVDLPAIPATPEEADLPEDPRG